MQPPLERSLDHTAPSSLASFLRTTLSRYGMAYWVLFCIPVASTQITGMEWLGRLVMPVWNAMVVWVGKNLLAISYEFSTAENGSGDKTSDWIGVFCVAVLAAIATAAWWIADRRRLHDERAREVVRVLVRYTLALVLLGYGVAKLFFGQFPSPNAARLVQRYGDSSPMGLLWTFMGASPAYVFFSGAGETLGALLLLFRRTVTLGAIVMAVVLTNVVMLNFCYDVPVKINSSHYLAMCVFLMIPALGRLASVLVLERPTQPVPTRWAPAKRWLRVVRWVVKLGLIGTVLTLLVMASLEQPGVAPQKYWYEGHWSVARFVRDGQEVPPLVTDTTRWKLLRFQARGDVTYVRVRYMDDAPGDLYTVAVDEAAGTMTLTPSDLAPARRPTGPVTLRFQRLALDRVALEGSFGTEALAVELGRLDTSNLLLLDRGFHWINEAPFNR